MRLHMNPMRRTALVVLLALGLGGCMTMPHKPPADVVQAKRVAAAGMVVSTMTGLGKLTRRPKFKAGQGVKIASTDARATLLAQSVVGGDGTTVECPPTYSPEGYVPPVRVNDVRLVSDTYAGLAELVCTYPELYCSVKCGEEGQVCFDGCIAEQRGSAAQ